MNDLFLLYEDWDESVQNSTSVCVEEISMHIHEDIQTQMSVLMKKYIEVTL